MADRKRQGGFTLIELITVIIILGILAATIAPRYFDMSNRAEAEAGAQALAEGVVHFNLAYMKYAVHNKAAPGDLDDLAGADYLGLTGGVAVAGDYRYTYSQAGDTVTVTAQRRDTDGNWDTVVDENGAQQVRTFEWP